MASANETLSTAAVVLTGKDMTPLVDCGTAVDACDEFTDGGTTGDAAVDAGDADADGCVAGDADWGAGAGARGGVSVAGIVDAAEDAALSAMLSNSAQKASSNWRSIGSAAIGSSGPNKSVRSSSIVDGICTAFCKF